MPLKEHDRQYDLVVWGATGIFTLPFPSATSYRVVAVNPGPAFGLLT